MTKIGNEYTLRNGQQLVIREAVPEDAERALLYIDEVAGETDNNSFGAGEFQLSVEEEANIIRQHGEKDNAVFLIAEIGGELVGMLNFSGGGRSRVRHQGEFGLSVRQKAWGHGIGRKLMETLIDWAKGTGIIKKINLGVRADNERAIALYKSLGFQEEGLITGTFLIEGTYYDTCRMGLWIADEKN